jgi:hypothetical protein
MTLFSTSSTGPRWPTHGSAKWNIWYKSSFQNTYEPRDSILSPIAYLLIYLYFACSQSNILLNALFKVSQVTFVITVVIEFMWVTFTIFGSKSVTLRRLCTFNLENRSSVSSYTHGYFLRLITIIVSGEGFGLRSCSGCVVLPLSQVQNFFQHPVLKNPDSGRWGNLMYWKWCTFLLVLLAKHN